MAISTSVRTTSKIATIRRHNSIYTSTSTIWLLQLTSAIKPQLHILKDLHSGEASQFIGVTDITEDFDGEIEGKLTHRRMKQMLNKRLVELNARVDNFQETPLCINISWLADELSLGVVEQKLLAYAVLLHTQPLFYSALSTLNFACASDQAWEVFSTMFGVTGAKMRAAISQKSKLIQSGLIKLNDGNRVSIEDMLEVPDNVCNVLLKRHNDVDSILRGFVHQALPAQYTHEDFSHLSQDFELICAYLKKAQSQKTSGVNILLYGEASYGKAEFARLIAKNIGLSLYEIVGDDCQGRSVEAADRLSSYMLSQQVLMKSAGNIVLFDEIDHVFSNEDLTLDDFLEDEGNTAKQCNMNAFARQILETNMVPAIWITNNIKDIEATLLNDFDYTVEFPKPPKEARRRLAQKWLHPISVSDQFIESVSSLESVTQLQIAKAVKIASLVANSPDEAEALIERTLKQSAKLLDQPLPLIRGKQSIGYDLTYLNTSMPIAPLISGLKARPSATFCFYGAPGTGKTAFAKYIAESIGKPLLVKRASDLLSKWVGSSEKNIAKMFQEAQQENAVLVLDEADSLLADRRGAHQSWEVTQVNELLTQMEDFNGIFICTTNLLDRLDPASLRRFAFKIRFDCLNREQRMQLFKAELQRLAPSVKVINDNVITRINRLDKLTPGDFSAVAKQWALWATQPTAEALITALEEECKVKGGSTKPIGFTS